jgi:hypothetical protein
MIAGLVSLRSDQIDQQKEYLMKHGSLRAVCLILMACIVAASGFSDEYAITDVILETFDHGDQAKYDWQVAGSEFSAKTDSVTYPRVIYTPGWSENLFRNVTADGKDANGNTLNVLGVNGAFTRAGYNWIDVYPVYAADDADSGKKAGDTAEIPIPGKSKQLFVWVWGQGRPYTIDMYVRDYRGIVHKLPLKSINYRGWRQLNVTIPTTIPQTHNSAPYIRHLTFVKFRINTAPKAEVSDFSVYFDQLTVLTDLFEAVYDGDTFATPARQAEIWNGASSAAAPAAAPTGGAGQ